MAGGLDLTSWINKCFVILLVCKCEALCDFVWAGPPGLIRFVCLCARSVLTLGAGLAAGLDHGGLWLHKAESTSTCTVRAQWHYGKTPDVE